MLVALDKAGGWAKRVELVVAWVLWVSRAVLWA
jgi:hypothetical protein